MKHIDYDFEGVRPEVCWAWIKVMSMCAALEKVPSDQQIESRIGESVLEELKYHLETTGISLSQILEKVMEDVRHTQSRREEGKQAMRKMRGYKDVSTNKLPTCNQVNPLDKIREDKNNTYIGDFFSYYLLKTGRKFRLTDENKKIIKGRLEDGYTLDQLKKAVDNFILDPWEGRKSHLDLIYCIGKQRGKPDNLEKWLNYKQEAVWKKP